MNPEQWRRAMVALAAVLLLVTGCTPEMKEVPLGTKPAAPSTPPSATSVVAAPSDTAPDELESVVPADQRADIEASGQHRSVLRVSDGDTIVVLPGRPGVDHIRPPTVDTPELHPKGGGPPVCGAEAARDALAGLLPGGTDVILKPLEGQDSTDRYGRTLADIYVERDGQLRNVSFWLAEQGWAVVFKSDEYQTADSDEAKELMKEAQAAHRGMWADCPVVDVLPR